MEQQEQIAKQSAIEIIQAIVDKYELTITDLTALNTCMEKPEYEDADEEDVPEPVNEKNYTIVEFRSTDKDKDILKLNATTKCYYLDECIKDASKSDEQCVLYSSVSVKSGHWEIYKVRRNSDGVEWTLGDTVSLPGRDDKLSTIEKFEVAEEYSGNMAVKVKNDGKTAISVLSAPVVKKQIILTTADGVDIYDKHQLLYGVSDLWTKVQQNYEGSVEYPLADMKNGKWFSAPQARDKYIQENEPKYTLKDIEAAWYDGASVGGADTWYIYKQHNLGIK